MDDKKLHVQRQVVENDDQDGNFNGIFYVALQTESFSTQNEAYKTAVPIQGMFYISRYPAFV